VRQRQNPGFASERDPRLDGPVQEVDLAALAVAIGATVDSAPSPDPLRLKRTHHIDDET